MLRGTLCGCAEQSMRTIKRYNSCPCTLRLLSTTDTCPHRTIRRIPTVLPVVPLTETTTLEQKCGTGIIFFRESCPQFFLLHPSPPAVWQIFGALLPTYFPNSASYSPRSRLVPPPRTPPPPSRASALRLRLVGFLGFKGYGAPRGHGTEDEMIPNRGRNDSKPRAK